MRFVKISSKEILGIALVAMILSGCPKTAPIMVTPPTTPPPPTAPTTLEKTFGEITYGGLSTLVIKYKDITLLVDPVFEPVGSLGATKAKLDTLRTPGQIQRTLPPALAFDRLPPIDYLLLTDGQPHHLGAIAKNGLRKNLKILGTNEAVAKLQSAGFTQSKGLSQVQRIMLKKNDGFLFVSVVQGRNPASGELVNGYMLEFDNGRNIFISGEIVDESVLRQFVYDLRDDGKQIDLAFVYGGGLHTTGDKVWQSANEDLAASIIGLLQPRVAMIVQTEGLDTTTFDKAVFNEKLKDQIFSGAALFPVPGEAISF